MCESMSGISRLPVMTGGGADAVMSDIDARTAVISLSVEHVLAGCDVAVPDGARLAARTCAAHLALLGAAPRPLADGGPDHVALDDGAALACAIPWRPGATGGDGAGGELLAQAVSGLMGVHGRSRGRPERIGLEVCSAAAGMLAATGLLAASIANRRGMAVRCVETSSLDAALCFLRHHLAIATCAEGPPAGLIGVGSSPPFATADGHLVELDAVHHEAWRDFWQRLGAERRDIARGWVPLAFRYNVGACALPPGLAAVAARHTASELVAAAHGSLAGVRRARPYAEVLADEGVWGNGSRGPWAVEGGGGPPCPPLSGRSGPDEPPLAGLRVVEVTTRVQGPLAGRLLALLGAEVTRVEAPGGDPARLVQPLAGSAGATFVAYNAGKRPVEVDYKTPAGRAQLVELLAEADVFLHNWPSGRAEKLGLDRASTAAANPGLVYCHAGGWPESGSEAGALGTDVLVQAHLGFGDGMNAPGEPARTSMVTLVDVLGGLAACEGAVAGLHLRATSGRGASVETSLASAAMAAQRHVLDAMAAGDERGRVAGRPLLGPLDRPLATGDGHLVVAVRDERDASALRAACGCVPNGDALRELLLTRSAAEWQQELSDAGLAAAVVRDDLTALRDDPDVAPLLEPADGDTRLPRSPWRFRS